MAEVAREQVTQCSSVKSEVTARVGGRSSRLVVCQRGQRRSETAAIMVPDKPADAEAERRCVEGSPGSDGGETGVISARGLAMRAGGARMVLPGCADGRVGELSCCTAPDSAATDAVKHAEFSEPPAKSSLGWRTGM